jgi:hypothetical protein
MAGAPVGNQNAAKAKRWADALNKALVRFCTEDGKVKAGEALDKIAEAVVLQALAGGKDAWQEIGNRLDGKAAQAVELSGQVELSRLVING